MPRKPNHPPILCEHFAWRLFQRDGVWYADGRNTTRDLGKHSLGTRERNVALESLKQLDHAMATRLGLVSRTMQEPSQDVPIDDGWRRYMMHCERPQVMGGCSANTLKRYRAVRDKHIAFCERTQVRHWAQVDKGHVERYGQELHRKNYADRTLHFELTQLKTVMKWLVDERLLPASAQFKLRLTRPEGSDRYCYRREEVQAMLIHCLSIPEVRWMYDVIAILAASGLRIGELASLRRSDIDFDAKVIVLADERGSNIRRRLGIARTTKGRRTRIVSLNPGLSILIQALPRHADGRLLHGPRGGRLRPKTVLDVLKRDIIKPLAERFPAAEGEIGFEHGTVHSLRHFFVSEAFRQGATESEIMEWVGHRDSKMVARYRHLRRDDCRQRMEQLHFFDLADGEVGRSPETA